MQLHSLGISGYRRFAKAKINLRGNVIAIVGPNEAGKTSILAALEALNGDQEIPLPARTRGISVPPEQIVLEARFRLDEADREQLGDSLSDNEAIWLLVRKAAGGPRTYQLDPVPTRNQKPRQAAHRAVVKAVTEPWFRKLEGLGSRAPVTEVDDGAAQGPSRVRGLATSLLVGDETLSDETLMAMGEAVETLAALDQGDGHLSKAASAGVSRVVEALRNAIDVEELEHPVERVDELRSRVPQFLFFADADRNLRSEYNLAEATDFNDKALRSLAAVAGLPLGQLRDAANGADPGKERALVEAAKAVLDKRLGDAWKQSPLTVSFGFDGTTIRINISSHEHEYFSLEDRSQGLQMFVALRMFLAKRRLDVPPILLVDEAESHLHYDAQADLVRVFEEQHDASQVIYTTHSIGCLPQDLGRGVRVVTALKSGTLSTIDNVWTRRPGTTANAPGVSPLVLAMGASTVPLAPSRYVVIGEGPSDAMLVPSLVREATEIRSLGYQVVGGLAEASDEELRRLDLEAPRVAYLLDGDAAGKAMAKRLAKVGVPAHKIVAWSTWSGGVELEDLVEPKLYASAVHSYLQSWPPHKSGPAARSLPKTGRPSAIKAWCKTYLLDEPSKALVAEEILRILDSRDLANERALIDTTKRN